MWLICKQFNILPNNPALRELTDEQKFWLLVNMEEEARQTARAYSGKDTMAEMGLDDDEFKEFSARTRKQIENGRS